MCVRIYLNSYELKGMLLNNINNRKMLDITH